MLSSCLRAFGAQTYVLKAARTALYRNNKRNNKTFEQPCDSKQLNRARANVVELKIVLVELFFSFFFYPIKLKFKVQIKV